MGERWTLAQRLKNDALFAGAAAALAILPHMPRRVLDVLGVVLGELAYVLFAAARRRAQRNLARVFGHASKRELGVDARRRARDAYHTLGRNLADAVSLLDRHEPPERTLALAPDALATLDAALRQRRGVVYVTGHLGPWERMACLLAAHGRPVSAVVRGSYDPRLDHLVNDRLRLARGVEPIDRGGAHAALAIARALRRGRIVGFLIDLPGRVVTAPAELFGLATRVPLGPARIALARRSPVVVGTPAPAASAVGPELAVSRERLWVSIEPVPYDDLIGHPEADRILAQRMLDVLSRRILALPDHWPWMHPSFCAERSRLTAGGR